MTTPSQHFILMGVSGTGKTSVAQALHQKYGWPYAEGDAFHPPENIAKMQAGAPLTDADRAPWLASIATWMTEQSVKGHNTLVTCSSLKRAYRDILRAAQGDVLFIHLTGEQELLAQRMNARQGHFMPASLLTSQFATLEQLNSDEAGTVIDVSGSQEEVATAALSYIERSLTA